MPKTRQHQDVAYRFDRLPRQMVLREQWRSALRETAFFYGFEPIHCSLFEEPRVFAPLIKAGVFRDSLPVRILGPGGEEFYLRMPGYAPLLRYYYSHRVSEWPHPVKLYAESEEFWERGFGGGKATEAGYGAKLLIAGEESSVSEAQIVQVIWQAYATASPRAGRIAFFIQPLGCSHCFGQFRSALAGYARSRTAGLCRDCRRWLKGTPVKILTCKEERCSIIAHHAPQILDYLCERCRKRLREFLEFLDEMEIPYEVQVRDLEKRARYDIFMFRFGVVDQHADEKDQEVKGVGDSDKPQKAKDQVFFAEGGRIAPSLTEVLAGRKMDAVAGAIDEDALFPLLPDDGGAGQGERSAAVFLAQLGDLARRKSLGLFEMMRKADIPVRESLGKDAIKSQLKMAERIGAELAVIVGQKEALDATVIVREVASGIQETVPQEKMVEFLRRKLNKKGT